MTHLRVCCGSSQAMNDTQHVGIVLIGGLVKTQCLLAAALLVTLVEDAQHTVKPIARTNAKTGYLDDDAVVSQTVNKRIGQSLRHHTSIIVVRLAAHIQHRLLDVAHLMPKNIHRHHRDSVCTPPLRLHVLLVGILRTKILTKTKRLRGQPGLLELYQDEMLCAVLLPNSGAKVDAEHRQAVTGYVGVLVTALLHSHHLLLQQG